MHILTAPTTFTKRYILKENYFVKNVGERKRGKYTVSSRMSGLATKYRFEGLPGKPLPGEQGIGPEQAGAKPEAKQSPTA